MPPLAKKYILQMLYIDAPVPAKSLEEWVLPDGLSKHRVAIDRLIQLRVLTESLDRYQVFGVSECILQFFFVQKPLAFSFENK